MPNETRNCQLRIESDADDLPLNPASLDSDSRLIENGGNKLALVRDSAAVEVVEGSSVGFIRLLISSSFLQTRGKKRRIYSEERDEGRSMSCLSLLYLTVSIKS